MLVQFNLIDRKENKISIEAKKGTTIKDAIMDKLSPGNFALCGGNCICATCHVYIAEEDFNKLASSKDLTISSTYSAIDKSLSIKSSSIAGFIVSFLSI